VVLLAVVIGTTIAITEDVPPPSCGLSETTADDVQCDAAVGQSSEEAYGFSTDTILSTMTIATDTAATSSSSSSSSSPSSTATAASPRRRSATESLRRTLVKLFKTEKHVRDDDGSEKTPLEKVLNAISSAKWNESALIRAAALEVEERRIEQH